ncbi:MAG: hypothetical protein WB774_18010, partial [Xanthobacteraceae bacterium]
MRRVLILSGLSPKADIVQPECDACFLPLGDISTPAPLRKKKMGRPARSPPLNIGQGGSQIFIGQCDPERIPQHGPI